MLPLVFANKADYNKIIAADFTVSTVGLAALTPGKALTLQFRARNGDKTRDFEVGVQHTMSEDQIEWFKAGSALNMIANQQQQK